METAPALPQAVAAVLVSEPPLAVTPTSDGPHHGLAGRGGGGVVVGDRDLTLGVRESRANRAAEVHQERLVRLDGRIAVDDDADRLAGLARCERQAPDRGHVIAARRGRAVRRRVVHSHRLGSRPGQRHGEHRVRRPGVAFGDADVVDGHRHGGNVVIDDRGSGLRCGDRRVGGVAQAEVEGLVRLIRSVAVDRHGDRLRGLARGEGQRSRGGDVIAA